MNKMIDLFKKIFYRKSQPEMPCVCVSGTNLYVLRDDKTIASIQWSQINKIITFKYDLLTTDEMRVRFLTDSDPGTWLEISEEWEGFREAIRMMENLFSSIPKDWFGEVMKPAFKTNETVLYERG